MKRQKFHSLLFLLTFLFILAFIPALSFFKENLEQQDNYYIPNRSSPKNNLNLDELNDEFPNLNEWNVTWGGSSVDFGFGVAIDGSNNVYLCGETWSFGAGYDDAFLAKYDTSGTKLWNITWGGSSIDYGWGVAVEGSNNVYLCGCTWSFGAGNDDAFLAKYDASGTQLWNTTWGGSSDDYGRGVAVDGNNNIYLCGDSNSSGAGSYDAFLAKYDASGAQLWNATWGGSSDDHCYGVAVDGNNNIYLCGDTNSSGAGSYDAFLAKYDTSGTKLWNVTWGGSSTDSSCGIAIDGSNNIYLCGGTRSFGAGSSDAFLAKFNASGAQFWNATWGGSSPDSGQGVAVDG
ncbi:MAG: SBBP repeat-containing protein, partial [Candidatus Helarchaeota archaeon]